MMMAPTEQARRVAAADDRRKCRDRKKMARHPFESYAILQPASSPRNHTGGRDIHDSPPSGLRRGIYFFARPPRSRCRCMDYSRIEQTAGPCIFIGSRSRVPHVLCDMARNGICLRVHRGIWNCQHPCTAPGNIVVQGDNVPESDTQPYSVRVFLVQ